MKLFTTNRNLLGNVAKCAVMQSPYHRPDNLEIVLDKLHELTKGEFEHYARGFEDWRDAEDWLRGYLLQIPEFVAWNKRKNGNKAPYGFVSAYDQPDPDNDFIDLDALIRNVVNEFEDKSV